MMEEKIILNDKRKISLQRAKELKECARPFVNYKKKENNIIFLRQKKSIESKKKILDILGGTDNEWDDWHWQLRNKITDVDVLDKILGLSEKEKEEINEVAKHYRWAISPYYLSLIDKDDKDDPIKKISIPSILELDGHGEVDPMHEEYTNPAGSITRRYPNRLIINVTNACANYCRHCQRRRRIGECDKATPLAYINESIEYIRNNEEITDVLITGGDPLTLSDEVLEKIIKAVREIEHVEIIRIGTRTLVTCPQRITPQFVNMLKKYKPIYINTHFNHPYEITSDSSRACQLLADNGICLGNQMVLLKGINNNKYVVRLLNEKLLQDRVRPYYIFHAKQVVGTLHFEPKIEEGLEIMQYLRGNTSGLAIPAYIINAPGGLGKIPILPEYIKKVADNKYILTTWEGKKIEYIE